MGVMLEQACIARHQCRCAESERQPERSVPGQNPQHRPKRQMLDIAVACVRGQTHGLQVAFGMPGIVFGTPGSLEHLTPRFLNRFPHLVGHMTGQFNFFGPHESGDLMQNLGTLCKAACAPVGKGPVRHVDAAVHAVAIQCGIFMQQLTAGGIDHSEHVALLSVSCRIFASMDAFCLWCGKAYPVGQSSQLS